MRGYPPGLKLWIWPHYRLCYQGRTAALTVNQGILLSALLSRIGHSITIGDIVELCYLDPDDEPEFSEVAVRLRIRSLRRTLIRNGLCLDLRSSRGRRLYTMHGICLVPEEQSHIPIVPLRIPVLEVVA